jgi:hypothetical protein
MNSNVIGEFPLLLPISIKFNSFVSWLQLWLGFGTEEGDKNNHPLPLPNYNNSHVSPRPPPLVKILWQQYQLNFSPLEEEGSLRSFLFWVYSDIREASRQGAINSELQLNLVEIFGFGGGGGGYSYTTYIRLTAQSKRDTPTSLLSIGSI